MAESERRSRSASTTTAAALTTGSMLLAGAGAGVLGATLLATPAAASTYTVLNTNNAGAGSLRQAILDANANPGIDYISFYEVAGRISLVSDLPEITEGVTIAGPGSAVLEIDGNELYHAFSISTAGSGAVSISGLTVTQSIARTGTGGAIDVHDTALTLDDMVLIDNSAISSDSTVAGGGLAVENRSLEHDVSISNTIISGNRTERIPIEPGSFGPTTGRGDSAGGGAVISADGVTLTNVIISDNDSYFGGGLAVQSYSNVTLRNTTISSNRATGMAGGTVMNADGAVSIISSDISNNTALYAVGGIYISGYSESSQVLISDTRISNNVAGEIGGVVVVTPGSDLLVERSSITGNRGNNIGGLSSFYGGRVESSTIADNIGAGASFGSPYAAPGPVSTSFLSRSRVITACSVEPSVPRITDVSATFTNSTVSGNTREGIAANIPLLLGYGTTSRPAAFSPSSCGSPPPQVVSIGLVHVLAADNGLEDVADPAISLFSLIERPNAGVFPGYGTQLGIDPQLQPLEFVNRTVSVVPILPDSPAWDAGYPGFVPPPATDQRGLPRVVQIIDIGAYEVQAEMIQPKFTG